MGAHHDHDHDHGFDGRSPEFRRALIVVIAFVNSAREIFFCSSAVKLS